MMTPVIETERLILRVPEMADFEPYCEMMADEETCRFIGGTQEPALAWRSFCGVLGHWTLREFGFFTVIERATGDYAGRVGPWYPHLWPQPEIGWTIARPHWGKGYASEAAAASMDFVFDNLGWAEVIHLIDQDNVASQGVARRIGSRNSGREVEVPGFNIMADVWGQSAEDWRNRDIKPEG